MILFSKLNYISLRYFYLMFFYEISSFQSELADVLAETKSLGITCRVILAGVKDRWCEG